MSHPTVLDAPAHSRESTGAPGHAAPANGASRPPSRLTGLAGLLSFDLIVVATFVAPPLWDAPGTRSSGAHVAAYARHNATRMTSALFIYSMAMGLFLCFVAGLWSWFRRHEPSSQALTTLLALAGCALVVLILAGFVPTFLLAYRSEPAAIAGLLGDTTFGFLALSGIPTAVFLAAYGAIVIRHGGLPRWTAYVAVGSAAAHLLIAASFLSHGPVVSLESEVIVWVPGTFFAWILVTSAVLYRRPPAAVPTDC